MLVRGQQTGLLPEFIRWQSSETPIHWTPPQQNYRAHYHNLNHEQTQQLLPNRETVDGLGRAILKMTRLVVMWF